MTPSKRAKELGCKSLKQVASLSGVHRGVLARWHKSKPWLFDAVCEKAMRKKGGIVMKKSILTVDIRASELDEVKRIIELNVELQKALHSLIEAYTNGCGLGGAWDKEFKVAQAVLTKANKVV